MRHTRLLFSLLALTGALFAQGTASLQFTQSFTTATTGTVIANGPTTSGGPQGSVGFRMVYYIQPGTGTVSALSVEVDGAPTTGGSYTALTPAPGGGSGATPSVNPAVTSPQGQNNLCCDFYPFLHIKVNTLTVATGTPILVVKVMGYAGTSAAANSSSSGGGGSIAATTNALKGDGAGNAVAVTGTGTNCVLVNGTSTACGGGGGTGATIVTYTPAASVTLTCPSSTTTNVTVFDPGGVALAANMAVTFASCTAGQVAILRTIQAASGGPFTVTGLPTGSPAMSTYPSAGTIYTLSAATSSTMTFVNVAANAGASSLGANANGISRTVTAGSTGVTVNLLADKDASNPTKYNTAALGSCGVGMAAYTGAAAATFELYSVPGTVLTAVADGTITAGHLLTGGASTAGRVADTGQTATTSVPLATCIVGVALASATVGNTVLVAYSGTGTYGAGAASSVAWNAITNPTGNLSLAMGANTSTFTYNAATGAGLNLWTLTDTASNTGTGALMRLTTAASSAAFPWQADANGAGFSVTTLGNQQQVGSIAFSANYGSISAGRGAWDGATTGHFVGSSAGTSIAVNESTGYTGSLIDVQVAGVSKFSANASGDISAAHGYTAGSGNQFNWSGRSFLFSPANGTIELTNASSTGFTALQLGGTTSSFPAFFVSGTGLLLRVADNSADTSLGSSTLRLSAAAPTVAAAQIGYGSTTAAASNCLVAATTCIVVNIAGTNRFVPAF